MKDKQKINNALAGTDTNLSSDAMLRQSINFLRENNFISDYDINLIVLYTYMVSKKIQHVELLIDKKQHIVTLQVFLNRFSYLFTSRKRLVRYILTSVQPVLGPDFKLNIEVKLNRYDKKD